MRYYIYPNKRNRIVGKKISKAKLVKTLLESKSQSPFNGSPGYGYSTVNLFELSTYDTLNTINKKTKNRA